MIENVSKKLYYCLTNYLGDGEIQKARKRIQNEIILKMRIIGIF